MSYSKSTHIYLKDKRKFEKLQLEVKTLWYERYGESLSNSELIMIAYTNLKESLSGRGDRVADDNKRQDIYKYCRTGIQSK